MACYNKGLLFLIPTVHLYISVIRGIKAGSLLFTILGSAICYKHLLIGLITRVLCQCITVLRRKVYNRSRKREIFIFACRKCSR